VIKLATQAGTRSPAPPQYAPSAPPQYAPNAPPQYAPNAPPFDPNAPPQYAPNAQPSPLPQVIPDDRFVQVRFAGDGSASSWVLEAGGREICETPCTLRYGAGTPIALRERGGRGKPARLQVPFLARGGYDVKASPRVMGAFAPGVVATTFGGIGAIVGIALTSSGCPRSDKSMCEGGLITAGAGAALFSTGIVLIAVSGPRVVVERSF
jgi:hypothetical protein